MVLGYFILIGGLASLIRAWWGRRSIAPPPLQSSWLAMIAFLPQLLLFHWPFTSILTNDDLARITLVISQALLLIFVWSNRRHHGMWSLGVGVGLNLLVIVANGGLMPISPEIVAKLAPAGSWEVGERLWQGKDIVLPISATRLWWLSDCLLLPTWFRYRVAFSAGDLFIAAGAFWLLWSSGEAPLVIEAAAEERLGPSSKGGRQCNTLPLAQN